MAMNKPERIQWSAGLLGIVLVILAGCDLQEDKFDDLKFDNASRYTVQVTPLTTEWSGFSLAPGEKRNFDKIDNPDFTWKPLDKVDVSVSSTDRNITFVDRAPTFDPNPTVVIITNVTSNSRR